jgi:hypothetical protein
MQRDGGQVDLALCRLSVLCVFAQGSLICLMNSSSKNPSLPIRKCWPSHSWCHLCTAWPLYCNNLFIIGLLSSYLFLRAETVDFAWHQTYSRWLINGFAKREEGRKNTLLKSPWRMCSKGNWNRWGKDTRVEIVTEAQRSREF